MPLRRWSRSDSGAGFAEHLHYTGYQSERARFSGGGESRIFVTALKLFNSIGAVGVSKFQDATAPFTGLVRRIGKG